MHLLSRQLALFIHTILPPHREQEEDKEMAEFLRAKFPASATKKSMYMSVMKMICAHNAEPVVKPKLLKQHLLNKGPQNTLNLI